MKTTDRFHEHDVLHALAHYLPAQAPLKDFIHHNTLHAFQDQPFFQGIRAASDIFGYKVSLSVDEYRQLYKEGKISEKHLNGVLAKHHPTDVAAWKQRMLQENYLTEHPARIGAVRSHWKKIHGIDLDAMVHTTLFRVICSYLDQGISIWSFPSERKGLLAALKDMERHSAVSFFRNKRARKLFLETACELSDLLALVVGREDLYEHYLFDQQFAHQGWSGMVSVIEHDPKTLLDKKAITLKDAITFELLLEIDALDSHNGTNWKPLGQQMAVPITPLFDKVEASELTYVLQYWQEAFEWTYYDAVLKGLEQVGKPANVMHASSFQALFCIDDRECSFRRHLESLDPQCDTYGTPGFFGVDCYYQPADGKFVTKICPAPVSPLHVIKEMEGTKQHETDIHFSKHAHSFHSGFLISQTLGFWSAFKLFLNIFRPQMSPATAYSFRHMDHASQLTVEHMGEHADGLQVGYTVSEMAARVEGVLRSIGLVENFAGIVYVIGHGASSVNNPHYAAYDCGACSGRAGSVNARAFSYMANHPDVRALLAERGIHIPQTTQFMGGLRDTTRDEIGFFDLEQLSAANQEAHASHRPLFDKALALNAKERSRRFESITTHQTPEQIHEKVMRRSVSLFEPRPELNHATNTLCIIGPRSLTKGLFLDRRSFLNSYDYRLDPTGEYLSRIVNAAAPVCGGINLEYYFSRVDNQKLGAGSKLPHNVMGLFGVANGIEGDLRPGLPSQMIEVHDPLRLLIVIQQYPEVVLSSISANPATFEWFANEWVKLVVIHPDTQQQWLFENKAFRPYQSLEKDIELAGDLQRRFEREHDNMPVLVITPQTPEMAMADFPIQTS